MIKRLRESRKWQLGLIVLLIGILPLVVDINNRLSISHQMKQEQSRLDQDLQALAQENQALRNRLDFVQGPEYIEWWARTQAHMTLSGETAIIPLYEQSKPNEFIAPDFDSDLQMDELSPAQAWHALFFGKTKK